MARFPFETSMSSSPHHRLIEMLAARSARRGTFTLASGKQSSFYIDARLTTMSPDGLSAIAPVGLAMLRQRTWDADSVRGRTLGSDPVLHASKQPSPTCPRPL